MRVAICCMAALLVCGIGFSLPAQAFQPPEGSAYWEVPRLGAPSQVVWEWSRVGEAKSPILEAFAARHGGAWQYQVNRLTGTFHHVCGSGIDLGRPVRTREDAESLARAFVADHPTVFRATNEDLRVESISQGLGKWSVIFEQTHGGVPVWGGRAHLVFTDAGRLFALGSDVYPGIGVSTAPSLAEVDAMAEARSSIGFVEGRDDVTREDLYVLPVEAGEEGLEYRLAYRFDLKVAEPLGIWATWIDARTGEILWRENHLRFVDFTGHSQGDVEWDGYCDGFTNDYPMIDMRIVITDVGTFYTNASGNFVAAYAGTGSKAIQAEFRGPYVNVNRASGTDASQTGTITAGVPYTFDWSTSNSLPGERDVFSYVNREHDWLKTMDPAFTSMDYVMTATIERSDGYCPGNAWWDGSGINLCSASTSYGNTGRMADVVYHEYGHGITQFVYAGNDPSGDIHEGNSDIVANYLTREHIMGLGYYLNDCVTGIRDSQNTIQYPCSGEIHYCGQLIAGFSWDAWQGLLAAYPQAYADSVAFNTWHFGRKLGLPQTMPDQVYWTFVADDDDGDLGNGTPHYEQLCTAATNHNFACPEITVGVFITHTPLGNTMNVSTPYPVTAEIASTEGPINVSACRVTYRVNGGAFVDVGMTATGNPDEYVGYIAPAPWCSEVEYYIYAADQLGNTNTSPEGAPATLHSFLVGYEMLFQNTFEDDKGWTVGAPDDDATTGIWERCDPETTLAQPGNDHTPAPGVKAYITQCAAGTGQGSYDVDGGKTTLYSGIYNLSACSDAAVVYYRWYSNDTGDNPGSDYWVVDVSDDGGTTWTNLENTNVSLRAWTPMQFTLKNYIDLTSQVRFRFVASDEGSGSLIEAGVDDFQIIACSPAPDGEPPVVEVLDPNGGERVAGGQSRAVYWTATDNVGVTLTTIRLSTDGGATYPTVLASGELTSPYAWNVPDVDEAACRVRVVCQDAALNEGSDVSDADFEILSSATGVAGEGRLPADLVLRQNQPNPFNPITEIEFGLPSGAQVRLEIYNVSGRLVKTAAEGLYPGGYHRVVWTGRDDLGREVPSGVYFYRLVTEDRVLTRKMLLLK